jgi:thiol-disulfide isomerase/thioredoxin
MTATHDPKSNPADALRSSSAKVRTRRFALATFGVAAAAVGAAVATRHFSLEEPDADDLWRQSFPALDGRAVALRDFRGRPLMINFWATWCPPCVEEMPLIDRFYQRIGPDKLHILGLAIDHKEAVAQFLQRTPVHYEIAMAGLEGVDLTKKLGNTAGALPFSVFFDGDGALRHRKLGELNESDLADWLT